jgi:hypothetical protein
MVKQIRFHRVQVNTFNDIDIVDLLRAEKLTKQLLNGWAYFVWPVPVPGIAAGLLLVSKHRSTIRRFVENAEDVELQVQEMAANEKLGEFGLFAINPDTGGGVLTRYSQDGVRAGLEWVLDEEHRRLFRERHPSVPRKILLQMSLLPTVDPRRSVEVMWAVSHQDYQAAMRSAGYLRAVMVIGNYSTPAVPLLEPLLAGSGVRRVTHRIELDRTMSIDRVLREIESLPDDQRAEIRAEMELAGGGIVTFELDKPRLPLATAELAALMGGTVKPKEIASSPAMAKLLEVYRKDAQWHSTPRVKK